MRSGLIKFHVYGHCRMKYIRKEACIYVHVHIHVVICMCTQSRYVYKCIRTWTWWQDVESHWSDSISLLTFVASFGSFTLNLHVLLLSTFSSPPLKTHSSFHSFSSSFFCWSARLQLLAMAFPPPDHFPPYPTSVVVPLLFLSSQISPSISLPCRGRPPPWLWATIQTSPQHSLLAAPSLQGTATTMIMNYQTNKPLTFSVGCSLSLMSHTLLAI